MHCAANEALAQDPTFIAAMQEAQSSCPQATTMTENSMSIDFSVCPDIKDDLVEVCDAVNGKHRCVQVKKKVDASLISSHLPCVCF